MTPFTLFVTLMALIASVYALALPNATIVDTEVARDIVDLEKRVTHKGRMTYYDPEGAYGACGYKDKGNDKTGSSIVAISHLIYTKANCNQYMAIIANGKTVYAKTRDMCPGCGKYDIDVSRMAFSKLYKNYTTIGVAQVSWHFMAKGWTP
ncbi:RlpA-like double-psi beta-barrel-protein domain-containing protein-containing protein [Auriculariales sp. MPI-PUGE-AT-0066]|nr:RlpA-like double-psi beta-barrel-protein domain-containing protein-containing protein [Auriculariales sp. MPI-PUGE-AT-0066]